MATKIDEFKYEGETFQQVGQKMKVKLLKYFKKIPHIFSCVTALNPIVNVEKETQFSVLAAMARNLLTVQASTVASESAISVSGKVMSQRRSRLSSESLECCICLKDYLDGASQLTLMSKQLYTIKKSNLEYHLGPKKTKTTTNDDADYFSPKKAMDIAMMCFTMKIVESENTIDKVTTAN
ncbi:hypothetical protein OSB04_028232 [Centaurea solstitialis]|uniref:HAT C-terminal dimerisation domain-containing protein n=1 Tax=Centaurea solstitialis TaxID=347529 RepID=A0AA38STL5_9ASTR|nr:hypothetical protein OSB04_028232 [Centaurea solstitialis]